MKVLDIYDFINEEYPFELAENWDNCGLIAGDENAEITGVMVALDLTRELIEEAVSNNVNLIITHHPAIFSGLKKITADLLAYSLIKNGISVISAHTNMDTAPGGVADTLCKALNLYDISVLRPKGEFNGEIIGDGRIGITSKLLDSKELAEVVKKALGCSCVRLVDGKHPVRKVAVANGAEYGLLEDAVNADADAFVAGEVKHNVIIDAKNYGITLVEAGHFETENIIAAELEKKLAKRFPDLRVVHPKQGGCPYTII